jgi:hypothetical protein
VGSGTVLVVATDERWLRVLEVTLRLGGYNPVARRSVIEASRLRLDDDRPFAIVLDLGADSVTADVEGLHELLVDIGLRTVVILPERLAADRGRFEASGARVLVRPYRPSSLYAALEPVASGGPRSPSPPSRSPQQPA